MEEQKTKCKENEEYVILIDLFNGNIEIEKLKDIPRTWPQGQFVSHHTGTLDEMENLRRNLILNNLKALMRNV